MGELSLGEEGGKKLEISSQIFIHEREREFKVVVECGERVGGGSGARRCNEILGK